MERILRGKCLVRKTTLPNGIEGVTLTGVFFPHDNLEISDTDEMWVTDLVISGGLKFTEPFNECSPEDFLSGENQLPKQWKNKTNL
jgi:hypothetical protein